MLVVQGLLALMGAFLVFMLTIENTRRIKLEERIDTLEKFAAKGDRFTQVEAAALEARIQARDSELDKRISLAEANIDHLWRTHHPKEGKRSDMQSRLLKKDELAKIWKIPEMGWVGMNDLKE